MNQLAYPSSFSFAYTVSRIQLRAQLFRDHFVLLGSRLNVLPVVSFSLLPASRSEK